MYGEGKNQLQKNISCEINQYNFSASMYKAHKNSTTTGLLSYSVLLL